ncbi:hypothetical protein ACFSYH_05940 [Populibacterium corticicola]|uniref:HNH endonuclease n=1 Tax=Populibacterium corticicola TaxID=1812826 RepID=A0ABW5XEG3_9MICO
MTAVTYIRCDTCYTNSPHFPQSNGTGIRRWMKTDEPGWVRAEGGKDICPSCNERLKAERAAARKAAKK